MKKPFLSLVIPAYNEEKNVTELYYESKEVFEGLLKEKRISGYEVIYVNDGSNDKTQEVLESLKKKENKIKILELRRNFGKTPALKAGFELAKGDLIIMIDADLQNDPRDIPAMIEKLNEGYDVVSGWRHLRKDTFSKRVFSKMMNLLRGFVIGKNLLHDYNCGLKLFKKECIRDMEFSGESHRYLCDYLYIKGYKIGEIKVNDRLRNSGVTKYKFNRGLNGILDLFYLKFWASYSNRPLHFFGRLGIYQWIVALIIIIEQIIKALVLRRVSLQPLMYVGGILVISGLLFIIFGFLSEIIIRIYFKDRGSICSVKKIV